MLAFLAAMQIAVSAVDSAPRPIAQLVHTRWTVKDGAPADIRFIAQTPDGYLWLAARSGLVRFDGVRFVPLPVRGADTIPNGGVQRLLAARDSSLWIVWISGVVSHWRDGRLRTYGERDGLPTTVGLTESNTRTLVAATKNGVWQFDTGKWKDVGSAAHFPGTECRSIWFDRDGTSWAVAEGRLVYRPAGSQTFVESRFRLTPTTYSSDFAQEKDGTIWMVDSLGDAVAYVAPRRSCSPNRTANRGCHAESHGNCIDRGPGRVGSGVAGDSDPPGRIVTQDVRICHRAPRASGAGCSELPAAGWCRVRTRRVRSAAARRWRAQGDAGHRGHR